MQTRKSVSGGVVLVVSIAISASIALCAPPFVNGLLMLAGAIVLGALALRATFLPGGRPLHARLLAISLPLWLPVLLAGARGEVVRKTQELGRGQDVQLAARARNCLDQSHCSAVVESTDQRVRSFVVVGVANDKVLVETGGNLWQLVTGPAGPGQISAPGAQFLKTDHLDLRQENVNLESVRMVDMGDALNDALQKAPEPWKEPASCRWLVSDIRVTGRGKLFKPAHFRIPAQGVPRVVARGNDIEFNFATVWDVREAARGGMARKLDLNVALPSSLRTPNWDLLD